MQYVILIAAGIIVFWFLVLMIRDDEKRLRGWWQSRDARGGRIYVSRKVGWGKVEYMESDGMSVVKTSWLRKFYWKASE